MAEFASARVAIIGGGVVGVSALYHLAKAGWTDCILLEKNELTAGSTWHAAGNVPTFSSSWSIMNMQRYSAELYRGLGEAVGINFVGSSDKPFLAARLEDCGPQDYFERGIELAIQRDRRKFRAVDISAARCMEVDFPTDLAQAETTFADLGSVRKG